MGYSASIAGEPQGSSEATACAPAGPETLISVIVPTYNGSAYIAPTLRSVLAQSHRAVEVIVVDDGSTDDTAARVEAFAACDPRVRLIRQRNQGVAAARQAGFHASRGAFVAPLDQDDVWHPETLAKELAVFARGGPELGMVYSWTQRIDEEGYPLSGAVIDHQTAGHALVETILADPVGHSSGALIRREALDALGGFRLDLKEHGAAGCEDQCLYVDLAEKFAFAYVPEVLIGYRKHRDSMSRHTDRMIPAYEALIAMVQRRHPEIPDHVFRRSLARAVFWLVTDTGAPKSIRRYWKVLARHLLASPGFMAEHWFLSWLWGYVRSRVRWTVFKAIPSRADPHEPPRVRFLPELYDEAASPSPAPLGTAHA